MRSVDRSKMPAMAHCVYAAGNTLEKYLRTLWLTSTLPNLHSLRGVTKTRRFLRQKTNAKGAYCLKISRWVSDVLRIKLHRYQYINF